MTQREMFEVSFKRPRDYFDLSPRRQFEIDGALGILDWSMCELSSEDLQRYTGYYIINRPSKNQKQGKGKAEGFKKALEEILNLGEGEMLLVAKMIAGKALSKSRS
ncbi:hypothetical protein LCGC14_1002570 [marine sediment metagenome]|uniref:Uncharacterized protein n=1 Tax=marine sediment metagenome TaxID=412755 RepID=A0A0F9N7D7_9ZZZZ